MGIPMVLVIATEKKRMIELAVLRSQADEGN